MFADILGIARYFACSKLMPNSTTQPISMYREPVHFPYLMTNGRCIVANEISSSEYAGSIKGQQPVKWHCSSECNTVTETEVAGSPQAGI